MKLIAIMAISLLATGALYKSINSPSSVTVEIPATSPALAPGASSPAPLALPQDVPALAAPEKAKTAPQVIVLNKRNTLSFRGVVTSDKVAKTQLELMRMSESLKPSEVIYLVLDTPGGEIDSGNQLIDTVHSLPNKVKTITVFAASMGFHFAQNMDERLILPSGTLMSHRAKGGMSGEIPGEFITRFNHLLRLLDHMNARVAERMGMNIKAYEELIHDEYWVSGQDAVNDKAADRVVYARCDSSFDGINREKLGEFFGVKVFATMSACPVVSGILGLEVGDKATAQEQSKQAMDAAILYQNRQSFVREYMLKKN